MRNPSDEQPSTIDARLAPLHSSATTEARRLGERATHLVLSAVSLAETLGARHGSDAAVRELAIDLDDLQETLQALTCLLPSTGAALPKGLAANDNHDAGRYAALEPDTPTPRVFYATRPGLYNLGNMGQRTAELRHAEARDLVAAYATSKGVVRHEQQDEGVLVALDRSARGRAEAELALRARGLFAGVLDGCGLSGDLASRFGAAAAAASIGRVMDPTVANLRKAMDDAGHELHVAERRDCGLGFLWTTASFALVRAGEPFHVVHVGDCRAYVLRAGQPLRPITTDHNVAAALVQAGELTPLEARNHQGSRRLTRSLRDVPLCYDEVEQPPLGEGEVLLLATDGLFDQLADEEIEAALLASPRPDDACRTLVAAAIAAGSDDNVTVVVIRG